MTNFYTSLMVTYLTLVRRFVCTKDPESCAGSSLTAGYVQV